MGHNVDWCRFCELAGTKRNQTMKKPSVRPRGYTSVTASLAVADVAGMLEFLRDAFEAEIPEAEAAQFAAVKLGNAMVLVSEGLAATGHLPQPDAGAGAVSLHLYVADVAATVERAVEAGATVISPAQDSWWGERTACLADPFGHRWSVAERIEALSPDQIAVRKAEAAVVS